MHGVSITIILVLGFWVYSKDKKADINRFFFFSVLSVVFWLITLFLFYTVTHHSLILFIGRLNFAATIVVGYFTFRFAWVFPKEVFKLKKAPKKFLNIITLLLLLITIFTPLIDKNEIILESSRQTVYGPLYFLFILYFVMIMGSAIVVFVYKLKRAPARLKRQVEYVLLGISLTAIGGFVTNILLPYLGYQDLAKLGPISILIFILILTYAILKHNLFHIKVVLSEILIGSFALLMFVNVFMSSNAFEYIWKGMLFVVFVYFGGIMVKNIIREIEAQEQLERYSKRLKTANKKLKKLDKQKTEFMSFAAHQLRSPLTSVKGFASLVLEGAFGKTPKKVKGAAEKIYEASEAMSDSVDDYLNISRIEQGRMEYNPEELDLYDLAQDVVEELRPTAYKKKLKLTLSSDKYKKYPARVDHSKVRQVINNFLDNAIKYTPKGEVEVRVERDKSKIKIAIQDSGIGMSQKTIKKLFQRYSRAQDTQGISGTGLGLYIARKMIEAQGGQVWAQSPGENQGSTFFIELPLYKKSVQKKKSKTKNK